MMISICQNRSLYFTCISSFNLYKTQRETFIIYIVQMRELRYKEVSNLLKALKLENGE